MLIKVSKDDSERRYSLIEMSHPPNIAPALNIHPNALEAYYVLEGEYLIECGRRTYHTKSEILYLFLKEFHIFISRVQMVEKYL
jgi:mannose-6-phosphate isomerase-like protein (cupin superfamily)